MKKNPAPKLDSSKKSNENAKGDKKVDEETLKMEGTFGKDITRVKEVFYCFDRDMDGKLDFKELGDALRAYGLLVSNIDLNKAKPSLSIDKSTNKTSFLGFMQAVNHFKKHVTKKNEIEDAMNFLVKSEKVELEELLTTLSTIGDVLSKGECEAFKRVMSKNMTGEASKKNLINFLASANTKKT